MYCKYGRLPCKMCTSHGIGLQTQRNNQVQEKIKTLLMNCYIMQCMCLAVWLTQCCCGLTQLTFSGCFMQVSLVAASLMFSCSLGMSKSSRNSQTEHEKYINYGIVISFPDWVTHRGLWSSQLQIWVTIVASLLHALATCAVGLPSSLVWAVSSS